MDNSLKRCGWLIVLLGILAVPAQAQQPKRLPTPGVPGFSTQVYAAGDQKSPLVTFVGCKPRPIAGALICQCPELEGYPTPSIVVGSPGDTPQDWRATLPPTATDEQIRAAFAPKAGQPTSAPPFDPSAPPAVAAEGSDPLHSLWGPHDYTQYRTTKLTQRVFNRTLVDAVPRSNLEEKWLVPGGLVGIKGWSSVLYKKLPAPPKTWRGDITIKNGLTHIGFDGYRYATTQTETSIQRSYYHNSDFLDVLVNSSTGKPFEVRRALKLDGVWYRSVHFRDRSQRPVGYTGLTVACATCHEGPEGPGTGGYNAGFVPGGDTIISDALAGLKQAQ